MAIGGAGGFGGFGGGQANIDLSAFGRGYSNVTKLDVIVAHSPAWFTLTTGFAAGVLLWAIPLLLFGANSLLTWVSTGAPAQLTYLTMRLPSIGPLVLGSGVLGILLATLRRFSARSKRYVTLGSFTVTLNTAFATVGGLFIAVGLAMSGSRAGLAVWMMGLGAPVIGFIVDGIWQMLHNLLLKTFGRPDMDILLTIEAEGFLLRHPGLGDFVLHSVEVSKGTALVKGDWPDKDTRDRVEQALRCIDGVDRVRMERE